MALKNFNLDEYCQKLHISDEGRSMLEKIANSEPVRSPQSGWGNYRCRYPSEKNKCVISGESRTLELVWIVTCEYDCDVIAIFDQPIHLKITITNVKTNRKVTFLYTPDFFVIQRDKAYFVECKMQSELVKLHEKNPKNYFQDTEGKWHHLAAEIEVARYGFGFMVISEREVDSDLFSNLYFLADYYSDKCSEIATEQAEKIINLISKNKFLTLENLISEYEIPADDIYKLVAKGTLYIDLSRCRLVNRDKVHVFVDYEIAQAIDWISTSFTPNQLVSPSQLIIKPNTKINWDGQYYKILNCGDSSITLISEDNQPVEMINSVFDELLKQSKISAIDCSEIDSQIDQIAQILAKSGNKQLAEATKRFNAIKPVIMGKSIEDCDQTYSKRTLYYWLSLYNKAQAIFNNGFWGLIPKRKSGNRDSRYGEDFDDLVRKFLDSDDGYNSESGPNKSTTLNNLNLFLLERNYPTISMKKMTYELSKLDYQKLVGARQGSKVAYKTAPPYIDLENEYPTHGERGFHVAHIDHKVLDNEFIHSLTGINLGKAYLTLMEDDFYHRVLGIYVSFNSPSYVSDMMVIRDCIRRNRRVPSIIYTDKGADFESTAYETLLAYLHITKIGRPTGKPRNGSIIERLFEIMDTTFFHNLKGNTKGMKNPREITPEINPKKLTPWTLPAIYERICEWCFGKHNKEIIHPALNGLTPDQAYKQGLIYEGTREDTYIAYDPALYFLTLPNAKENDGYRKLKRGKGIQFKGSFYYSKEFDNSMSFGKKLLVKWDPANAGYIYAFHEGKYVQCLSTKNENKSGRSWREIEYATLESRKISSLDQTTRKRNGIARGKFNRETKDIENQLIIIKYRDQDSACIDFEIKKDFHLSNYGYIDDCYSTPLTLSPFSALSVEQESPQKTIQKPSIHLQDY